MEIADIYNQNAAYWESTLYRMAYHRPYIRLFRSLHQSVLSERPQRVLDCGIGAALFSESLLNAMDSPIEVHGVDVSSTLLARARAKLISLGAEPGLTLADISNLPYRVGEMDMVLSALVLEHVPKPLFAVREMARVLRPGGWAIIVGTRTSAPDHFFRRKYRYHPYGAEAVLNWMRAAGLADVRSYRLTGIARFFARAYLGVKR